MVEYKWIYKSIDEAIIKCRTGGQLSSRVKKTLNTFAEKSRKWRKEQAIVIDANGEILYSIKGKTYSVNISSEEVIKLIQDNGMVGDFHIDHNHPTPYQNAEREENLLPTSLSYPDVMRLVDCWSPYSEKLDDFVSITPYKSVTAECPNGSRMTLNRLGINEKNKVLEVNEKGGDEFQKFMDDYTQANRNLGLKTGEFCQNIIKTGGLLEQHMDSWVKEWNKNNKHNQEVLKHKPVEWDKMEFPSDKEYNQEKNNFITDYSKENYKDFLKDNIKEFKDLGFELSVEWTV